MLGKIQYAVGLVFILLVVTISSVSADPTPPYSGSADATSITGTLTLLNGLVPAEIDLLVNSQSASIDGTSALVATEGEGNGVDVVIDNPIIGVDVDLINAVSAADTDTPTTDTDSDSLATVSTLLVDTGAISTESTSTSTATRGTSGAGDVDGLTVFGNILGTQAFLDSGLIETDVQVQTTTASDALESTATSAIEDLDASVTPLITLNTFLTADAVTSTATAACDGTAAGTIAAADVEFVNLLIQGDDFTAAVEGTVVPVVIAGLGTVANVTVRPTVTEEASATTASATAVALRITFTADVGLLAAGTTIDIGTASAACDASVPSGITLADLAAEPVDNHILVSWETLSEVGNVGFNLYRGTSPAGPDVQLNDALIPSEGPNSDEGFAYDWIDQDVEVGVTYYYWLDAVDTDGNPTRFGPVSATLVSPTAVVLTSLDAGHAPLRRWIGIAVGLVLLTFLFPASKLWK